MAGDSTKVSYVLKGTPVYSLANDGDACECVPYVDLFAMTTHRTTRRSGGWHFKMMYLHGLAVLVTSGRSLL